MILDVRNRDIQEQVNSFLEEVGEQERTAPSLQKSQFFARLQMKLMMVYMYLINHENRYMLDRMMHIFWVLAMLVLLQFHLLHISSFSFVSPFLIFRSTVCPTKSSTRSKRPPSTTPTYSGNTSEAPNLKWP